MAKYGDGSIDNRGPGTWRLRYRAGGRTVSKTIHAETKKDARTALRSLLKSVDDGAHVQPHKLTLNDWAKKWLDLKAPNIEASTLARYDQLLRTHILPALGKRPLLQIEGDEIDAFYGELRKKGISDRTLHHVHVVLKGCLKSAIKKKKLVANPVNDADEPEAEDSDAGTVLEKQELATLVRGFRDHGLYEIVAVAAYTGARRNEILALQWSDLDVSKKTLRIERSLEEVKVADSDDKRQLMRRPKVPKTKLGKRTIDIDDGVLGVLRALRERHQRIVAGIPDGVEAPDLSLVKLPEGALMFPAPGGDLTDYRDARAVYRVFKKRAKKLGFDLRFHDLRGTHETLLLDEGVPVHTVAARCGHDPAVLLKAYAKRTRGSDKRAAEIIGAVSRGVLGW
jgi:integrase